MIEAQKYARRAEQLAVLKTFAEGELLRRLPQLRPGEVIVLLPPGLPHA